jgi:hypothetical protein
MFKWLAQLLGMNVETRPIPEAASTARVPASDAFWLQIESDSLAQGDLLRDCFIPDFPADFGVDEASQNVQIYRGNLIILTQSCDLENRKVGHVALAPICSIATFSQQNPDFKNKGRREEVRRGRHEGLYLFPSPEDPRNNQEALVVDFRQIISLPFGYLTRHANGLGLRWRLQSPYLEHFSQAFARFFMRVGLPSAIPPYK